MKTREETVKHYGGNLYTDKYEPRIDDPDDRMLLLSKRYEAFVWPNKTNKGWYNVISFSGKTFKGIPIRLPSFESVEKHIQKEAQDIITRARKVEEEKTQRKLYRYNLISTVKPGDILYSSWGWDQTNVNFYQVIDKTKTKFTIRELQSIRDYDKTGNGGLTRPKPSKFCREDSMVVSVTAHGFKIDDVQTAKPLEFKFDEFGNRVYDSKQFSVNW